MYIDRTGIGNDAGPVSQFMIRTNQIVILSRDDGSDTVLAKIEDVRGPDDLPSLPGFVGMEEQAAEILKEWQIDQIALISYWHESGKSVAFHALHAPDGWYDLRRQKLTVAPWRPA